MSDIRISDLAAATNMANIDLLVISQDNGDTTYTSKKITGANFDMVKGIRYYGLSATDPTTPTPADGDQYYNIILDKKMYYDVGRAKWLSFEQLPIFFGRNGLVTNGSYYRSTDGLAFSSTSGFYTPWAATIVGMTYTRDDTDQATFVVTAGGVDTTATLSSAAVSGATTSLNVNINTNVVLGVRNYQAVGGNTTNNVNGVFFVRWRI